jgi:hypothetical protein
MRKRMSYAIAGLVTVLLYAVVYADGQSLVMSIPHAISNDHIYKVTIDEIDGMPQEAALNYPLPTGEHVIKVSIMLNLEWTPKLEGASATAQQKDIVLNIDPGTIYRIGAQLDIDAPIESQLDGSYWEPIVYRETED